MSISWPRTLLNAFGKMIFVKPGKFVTRGNEARVDRTILCLHLRLRTSSANPRKNISAIACTAHCVAESTRETRGTAISTSVQSDDIRKTWFHHSSRVRKDIDFNFSGSQGKSHTLVNTYTQHSSLAIWHTTITTTTTTTTPHILQLNLPPPTTPNYSLRHRRSYHIPSSRTDRHKDSPIYKSLYLFNFLPENIKNKRNHAQFKFQINDLHINSVCPCSSHPISYS